MRQRKQAAFRLSSASGCCRLVHEAAVQEYHKHSGVKGIHAAASNCTIGTTTKEPQRKSEFISGTVLPDRFAAEVR